MIFGYENEILMKVSFLPFNGKNKVCHGVAYGKGFVMNTEKNGGKHPKGLNLPNQISLFCILTILFREFLHEKGS